VTEPSATLAGGLATDLGALERLLRRETPSQGKAHLQRVAAQLALITAMVQTNLGQFHRAGRWWRTAARAAEQSGDQELYLSVLGRRAIRGIFEGRAPGTVVQLAERAITLAGSLPVGAGVMEAHAARAQALSLLGDRTAVDTLHTLNDSFGRLPAAVTSEGVEGIGYFRERNLRHTQSFVYTHLNDRRAEAAQDQSLALYPPTLFLLSAKVELHRARWLVGAGDMRTGVAHARDTLLGVPVPYRDHLLIWTAREFLNAVPAGEQRSPAVMEYRELVAQAATT
jgi:hypothetical protein